MKRLAIYLALVLPVLGLVGWRFFPAADPAFVIPLGHFYIVTFTTFAATVVSLFVTISVGQTALPRHLLLAVAFAWMGGVFLVHGLATPGALITHFHPGIVWGAWLTLFGGGVIFLVSGLTTNTPHPRLIRLAALSVLTIYAVFVLFNLIASDFLNTLLALEIAPPLAEVIFWVTTFIWLASGLKHFLNYRTEHNFFDGLMAFESVWFATATVSLFKYPLWHLSWWLYHLLLLGGFLIASYALWRAYEQVRAFRLIRYFAATSLIFAAALALLSAQLYSQVVYDSALDQLRASTQLIGQNLALEIAERLPHIQTFSDLSHLEDAEEVEDWAVKRLVSLGVFQEIYVYDTTGAEVLEAELPAEGEAATPTPTKSPDDYSKGGEETGGGSSPTTSAAPPMAADMVALQTALGGKAVLNLYEPGHAPSDYHPGDHYILEAYLPFKPADEQHPEPVGVFWAVREAPELTEALTLARRSGIGLAALSLGGLFLALLFVIRRADLLITHRARELETAYNHLREAEGMRDDLTNMIVHDLRNPLTAITMNLELIGKLVKDPANAINFVVSARSASQRMIDLIDDLLNVGKIEAGELRPMLKPLDLATFLPEKASAYAAQVQHDHKTIILELDLALPEAKADVGLIGRVIDNLLSNALKYTSPGGRITLGAKQQAGMLCIEVGDNGEGIPPDYHQRIFDKFIQVTDERGAALRKGTGLGLAFCRLVVEAHGGRIWVESEVGQGSRFYFTLPIN